MSIIEDELGQKHRREPSTVRKYLAQACPWQYQTEVYHDLTDGIGRLYGVEGFQMDARIKYRNSSYVGIEAKQFVTDGLELLKGCPTEGIGQAVRYAHHCGMAELWHFYVVPYYQESVDQKCALMMMANLHERVEEWLEPHDSVSLRSIAVRHTRDEVQVQATLGDSVIGDASSEPDDLKTDRIPRQLR